jgi:hypothetical protein
MRLLIAEQGEMISAGSGLSKRCIALEIAGPRVVHPSDRQAASERRA